MAYCREKANYFIKDPAALRTQKFLQRMLLSVPSARANIRTAQLLPLIGRIDRKIKRRNEKKVMGIA